MQQLTLQNIMALAGKTTDGPFTPEEVLSLKSKVQFLIAQRLSSNDGITYTSIISVRDIAIGYGPNHNRDSKKERIVSISFNVVDTETKKDDERVYRIRRHARYLYHFSIREDGTIQRSSSDNLDDGSVKESSYYIQ